MMKVIRCVFFLLLWICSNIDAQHQSLTLDSLLNKANLSVTDLGIEPRAYWTHFPNPKLIPHKLPIFDDLYGETLQLYPFIRSLGNVIEDFLDLDYLNENTNSLYKIVYFCGIEQKVGGFRDYSPNLIDSLSSEEPMIYAMKELYRLANDQLEYKTFGKVADFPNWEKSLRSMTQNIPAVVQEVIGILILNIADALHWHKLAFRNVSISALESVFRIRDLDLTQGDGQKYYPEFDDVASQIDWQSLTYGAVKVIASAETATYQLRKILDSRAIRLDDFEFNFETPFGRIILSDKNSQRLEFDDVLLSIDFGGDDVYRGNFGGNGGLLYPISICIDLGGNDQYENLSNRFGSQGAGICGYGILIDDQGSDNYSAKKYAQGVGVFGYGLLMDRQGKDRYQIEASGQGAGYFGLGFLADVSGDDHYYLHADGQGFGGVGGGIGVLADYEGNDEYVAEPSAQVANRGDYHSEFNINVNSAQGAGMGRRGDGSDGHSWAGGFGFLADIHGNDRYTSGNWSIGCGYWFGIGALYDKEGNDQYESVYFTQASGAHFAMGCLIDESGDDKYRLSETAGAGLAFGWDFTNALLIDKSGDDTYESKIISFGCADIRSVALFFDLNGNDVYRYGQPDHGFGSADFRKYYAEPSRYASYMFWAKTIGLFIDSGGKDKYKILGERNKGKSFPFKNNSLWFSPSTDSEKCGFNNIGMGADVKDIDIPEFYIYDAKK